MLLNDYNDQFKEHEQNIIEKASGTGYISPTESYSDADWMISIKNKEIKESSEQEKEMIKYLNDDFVHFVLSNKVRWVEVKKRFNLMSLFSVLIGKPLITWDMEDLLWCLVTIFPNEEGRPLEDIPELKESVHMNDTMTSHDVFSTIKTFVTQARKYITMLHADSDYKSNRILDDYKVFFQHGDVQPQINSREINFAIEKYYLILNPFESRMNALLEAENVMRKNLDPNFHLYVCTFMKVCLCGVPSNYFLDLKWRHLLESENFNDYLKDGQLDYQLAGQKADNGVNLLLDNNAIVNIDNDTIDMLRKSYHIDYLRKGWKFEGPEWDSAIKFSTFNIEERSPKMTKERTTIKICHLFINYIVKFGGPNIGPVYVNKRGLYEKLVNEYGIEEARKMISFDPKNQSPLRTNSLLLFAIKNGKEIKDIANFKRKMLEIVY